jgi:N-methylhydantoinase A
VNIRCGIDTGGTFTDLVAVDEVTGRLEICKRPSVPANPGQAIFDVLEASGLDLDDISYLVLGTTVAVNCLLTKSGARVLYLATAGFEDIPFLQRVHRKYHYDLTWERPLPLVARRDCIGVNERVDYHGRELRKLKNEELERLKQEIEDRLAKGNGRDVAVAVNLLFSYAGPEHEERLRDFFRRNFPNLPISYSHDVAPIWREYERSSTTIIDAYIKPLVGRFIGTIEAGLVERGYNRVWAVMKSNGGQMHSAAASAKPVQVMLSGLSGGIIAGRYFGEKVGQRDLITFDMGGTSTDVAVVINGEYKYTTEWEMEFGVPVAAPFIDLTSIGAGGGSIAWIDKGGFLKVGPQSAGADPGPLCYDNGGEDVTVTDANLVLGRLDPDYFLGSEVKLNADLAQQGVEAMGRRLGLSLEEMAHAVIEVANENMVNAVRLLTVKRGLDPRDFHLVAFGGAGPLHASAMAASLRLPSVIVPPHPGLSSAFGTLLADLRVDTMHTHAYRSDSLDLDAIDREFNSLVEGAVDQLRREGFAGEPEIHRSVSTRYAGQNYEEEVAVPPGRVTPELMATVLDEFQKRHEQFYGYRITGEIIELVQFNVTALGHVPKPDLPVLTSDGLGDPIAKRPIYFKGYGYLDCPIYRREVLGQGIRLTGPALIQEMDSTTLVHPGQELSVSPHGIITLVWEK